MKLISVSKTHDSKYSGISNKSKLFILQIVDASTFLAILLRNLAISKIYLHYWSRNMNI